MVLLFRKYFILIILIHFFGLGQALSAQNKHFTLNWNMDYEIKVSNGTKFSIPVIENNFIDNNSNPSYDTYWNISTDYNNVSYVLKNIVFEKVEEKYLNLLALEYLTENVTSSLRISHGPSLHGVTLTVVPLIKKGKEVHKIISFDIDYELFSVASKSLKTNVTDTSVLSSGDWYKFSIDKTGVFKLDKNFIESLGVSVSDIDPRDIRIYGNGGGMLPNLNSEFRYDDLQENSIYVNGEDDGSFNDGDYVLFYGVGAHDWVTPSESQISHRKNIYSEETYYFLNIDLGRGKRIAEASEVTTLTTDVITTYKDYVVLENDLINLIGAGQQWFGDSFSVTNDRTYNFEFENLDISKDLKFVVRGASTASTTTSMLVSVNDTETFTLNYSSINDSEKAITSSRSSNVTITSSNIDVNIKYNNNGNPTANAYLDYIEIIGDKLLIASGKQFFFRNFSSQQNSKVLEYSISNASSIDMVWDVTNSIEPKIINNQSTGSNFIFKSATSGVLNEYAVLNNSDYYSPKVISTDPISNQNLHGLKDIQYLVITNEDLSDQAQRLADYHKNNSNLSTKVVSLKEIYNEFGSGSPDITAIRDFVKHLYDNASSEELKIKYLCLFGDSSYDYKDRISGNNNIVPVYLAYESFNLATSYVTDDYYGMMDSNEGGMITADKQDVATGRILVSDNTQAEIVVNKILAYYDSNSYGAWRNSITFVTGDPTDAGEASFTTYMDQLAASTLAERPQYNIKKIYSDSYVQVETSGGSRYPDVNTAIANSMEKGVLLFNYFGHGGETGFAEERIVSIDDIQSWVNFEKSPLFITITCDFTRFDNPAMFTAGEEMVVSNKGGSASLISTSREVYVPFGKRFNKTLIPNVLDFENKDVSIAEALMNSKNLEQHGQGQHYFIYYLGDPAMKLGMPKPNIKVTHINDKDVLQSRDTLKALSKIKISGEIQDENGNLLNDFNGELSTIIYDKPTSRTTLNNDGYPETLGLIPFIFEIQENSVFKGKANVNNGKFSYDFIVPKDIKLAYGASKISLYFNNEVESKGGYDLETIIGGINDSPDSDDEGPEIELFMEDNSFLDGGNTSANPVLIAQFLDKSGVNTSTGGIGHSITAVIDGDDGNPIELNEFYEAETGDFTKGVVNYTIRDLEAGPHTVKLKVWDTYNNASDKTLNFTVTESSEFVLENVLNYPNPFIDYTEFWFTHNQPNDLLDVKIYIYTVSGKLVKSISEVVQTSGILVRSITWNGKDDFGDRVGKGVYVYKLEVTNVSTGVRTEKFEKLVLLQ